MSKQQDRNRNSRVRESHVTVATEEGKSRGRKAGRCVSESETPELCAVPDT